MSRVTPFDLREYADISTRHVNKRDGELMLEPNAPYHIANEDERAGSFFYVPLETPTSEMRATLVEFGFSEPFVQLFVRLHGYGVPYVRFDCDGGSVQGAPEFSW